MIRTQLRAGIATNLESRPEVWFGYSEDSPGHEAGVTIHTHSNLFYTYSVEPRSLVEAAAAAADVNADRYDP